MMAAGNGAATATKIEPKTQPFADESTGEQRRVSGAWAKGGGEGAKILALRPDQETRASEDPTEAAGRPPATSEARPDEGAASTAPAVNAAREAVGLPADASSSGVQKTLGALRPSGAAGEHRKPLVLASESLRADLAPNVPGRGRIRVVAVIVGGLGAAAVVAVAEFAPASFAVAACLAFVAALGVARLHYRHRAAALLAVALPNVGATSVFAAPHGGPPHGALLALLVCGLAGALYFRAKYRASRLARGLVGVGVALGVGWLLSSGIVSDLSSIDATWQSWLPTLLGASLAPVLALALLGFMTHNTTGGCATWATALLIWLTAYECAVHAAALFPASGASLTGDWRLGIAMGTVAAPAFATVAAMALAQLLVVVSGGGREEPAK
jgi:hypothetical protein